MGVFIDILLHSIGNLFLGVILTIAGVVLMFVLIQSWYKNSQFSVGSYIAGACLFVFLSFQSVLLCGAVTVKSYTDDIEVLINGWVSNIPESTAFSREDSQRILEGLVDEYPLVGRFVDTADFTGHTPSNIAASMMSELRSCMNYYMLRRVLWGLAFIIISAFLVIKSMDTAGGYGRRGGSGSSRSGHSRSYSSSRHSGGRRRYDDL